MEKPERGFNILAGLACNVDGHRSGQQNGLRAKGKADTLQLHMFEGVGGDDTTLDVGSRPMLIRRNEYYALRVDILFEMAGMNM